MNKIIRLTGRLDIKGTNFLKKNRFEVRNSNYEKNKNLYCY